MNSADSEPWPPESGSFDSGPTGNLQRLQLAELLLQQNRFTMAERQLLQMSPDPSLDVRRNFLQGRVLLAAGGLTEAMELFESVARGTIGDAGQRLGDQAGDWSREAVFAVADLKYLEGDQEGLRDWLDQYPDVKGTPRAQLFAARLMADGDPEQAESMLFRLSCEQSGQPLGRLAGFDAVALRDRLGRYRDAWELARSLQASADVDGASRFILDHVEQQLQLLDKPNWTWPRYGSHRPAAFVVGLPRSGTSLLSQMLDAHPDLHAIGEYDGMSEWITQTLDAGAWPYRLKYLGESAVRAMQDAYFSGARQRVQETVRCTVDKTLLAWCWIPLLHAVLPDATCIHIERDPRDLAVSLFLSYFRPGYFDWTSSLESIHRMIRAERTLMPRVWERFDLPSIRIRYEDLVGDPASIAGDCLRLLGLPMNESVAAPERNPRRINTLSFSQVRQPIRATSVGRWNRYAWLFDDDWHALAEDALRS